MSNQNLFRFSVLFALSLEIMTAHSAFAFDPPPWQGVPWGNVFPWPTAHPLSLGESWSPGSYLPPAPIIIPSPTPTMLIVPVAPQPASRLAPMPAFTPIKTIPGSAPSIPVIYVTPVPTLAPTQAAPAVSVVTGGSSFMDALLPSDAWAQLDPGASVWYRIGTDGMQMSVALELNPANSNMGLLIFAPGQFDKPIGKGTSNGQDFSRLVWAGGHWSAQGYWYAQVINYNPMAMQYHLFVSARDNSNKSCHSYWEHIGANPVFWTICE